MRRLIAFSFVFVMLCITGCTSPPVPYESFNTAPSICDGATVQDIRVASVGGYVYVNAVCVNDTTVYPTKRIYHCDN